MSKREKKGEEKERHRRRKIEEYEGGRCKTYFLLFLSLFLTKVSHTSTGTTFVF